MTVIPALTRRRPGRWRGRPVRCTARAALLEWIRRLRLLTPHNQDQRALVRRRLHPYPVLRRARGYGPPHSPPGRRSGPDQVQAHYGVGAAAPLVRGWTELPTVRLCHRRLEYFALHRERDVGGVLEPRETAVRSGVPGPGPAIRHATVPGWGQPPATIPRFQRVGELLNAQTGTGSSPFRASGPRRAVQYIAQAWHRTWKSAHGRSADLPAGGHEISRL